ncbi:hypothetical protein CAPTEDRAFT_198667 [Capitella teleta]|uniref:Uncharacterized protein n=1 Tax=Capitella teleta TaxID=283909 RepID=R7V2U0_CAPTE|nr:hypothetical protein CAPTEDRAFT_198667 [Capitella teleta]|eukprot:ELU12869.1 hypothetical protein CAPTEDRAFT_198667 [Capitella teleta]
MSIECPTLSSNRGIPFRHHAIKGQHGASILTGRQITSGRCIQLQSNQADEKRSSCHSQPSTSASMEGQEAEEWRHVVIEEDEFDMKFTQQRKIGIEQTERGARKRIGGSALTRSRSVTERNLYKYYVPTNLGMNGFSPKYLGGPWMTRTPEGQPCV